MGTLKQLLPIGDKPVIKHCIDCLITSGIQHIVVVLGHRGAEIQKTIDDNTATIVFNDNPDSEMAESVRIGLRATNHSITGILIFPSDHPLVSPQTVKTLIQVHNAKTNKIIIPKYNGKRGHPSLFPKPIIEEIFTGIHLKEVINKHPESLTHINVMDEGVILDMDRIEDYKKILEKAAKGMI